MVVPLVGCGAADSKSRCVGEDGYGTRGVLRLEKVTTALGLQCAEAWLGVLILPAAIVRA